MKKLAIVKLSAMGDIIHSMVVLDSIKKTYPNLHITWFVEESFTGVLEHNPNIDEIVKLNLKSIKKSKKNIFKQLELIRSYKDRNFDVIIDAQGLIKSAIVARLLGKNVVGFSKNSTREGLASIFYSKKVEIAYEKNVIDRNAYLFKEALNLPTIDILSKKPFLYYKDEDKTIYDFLQKDKKNILLVIGASWQSKIYPKERFCEVIDGMSENFLVLWGSENEQESASFIAKNTTATMLPKMSLNTLKALISKVDLVIGNDTGPTHMAWALNIPSITLFGPTPQHRNTYTTTINKTLKSSSKVDPLKLDKQDKSIGDIAKNDIISLAYQLLENHAK